ncbi:hypothetical protein CDL15_Pgr029036 [Punica granatum]|uniref:Wax synthase domain-containing protein n=1 Tax=Punica granatum TaxID=22663 RepID=A0A218XKX3_PUNGR|nr:hypothetical protein CDL15_Pgr029036 [Punica granatum]
MSEYNDSIHPKVIYFLYCFHIYFTLNVSLALLAAAIRATFRMELEQQFNELHLTTSLQGPRSLAAMLAAFLVSGLLHEVIINCIHGTKQLPAPTWDINGFFLLHGMCLVAELVEESDHSKNDSF